MINWLLSYVVNNEKLAFFHKNAGTSTFCDHYVRLLYCEHGQYRKYACVIINQVTVKMLFKKIFERTITNGISEVAWKVCIYHWQLMNKFLLVFFLKMSVVLFPDFYLFWQLPSRKIFYSSAYFCPKSTLGEHIWDFCWGDLICQGEGGMDAGFLVIIFIIIRIRISKNSIW